MGLSDRATWCKLATWRSSATGAADLNGGRVVLGHHQLRHESRHVVVLGLRRLMPRALAPDVEKGPGGLHGNGPRVLAPVHPLKVVLALPIVAL